MTPTELRKAAAEVEGWKQFEEGLWCHDEYGFHICSEDTLPNYAEDPVAALRLVEVMRKKGYTAEFHNGHDGSWDCILRRGIYNGPDTHLGQGATLALAITMAVLKAEGRLNEC